MPTPIDPKRLPGLRAAIETFKPGDMVSQKDLAKIYGVTNARLTTLIKNRFEDFPPAERHGDKTHWYEARRAIECMIAYLEGAGKKKKQAASRAAEMMGRATKAADEAQPEAEEPPPLGPAELDRLASASTRIWRLAIEQGKYVETAKVKQVMRGVLDMIRRDVTSLPTIIDPNGELAPLRRAAMEQHCRKLLVRLHDELDAYLETVDADA